MKASFVDYEEEYSEMDDINYNTYHRHIVEEEEEESEIIQVFSFYIKLFNRHISFAINKET